MSHVKNLGEKKRTLLIFFMDCRKKESMTQIERKPILHQLGLQNSIVLADTITNRAYFLKINK
jgi:hypothetical protein